MELLMTSTKLNRDLPLQRALEKPIRKIDFQGSECSLIKLMRLSRKVPQSNMKLLTGKVTSVKSVFTI